MMEPELLVLLQAFFFFFFSRRLLSSVALMFISRVNFCGDENAAWPRRALGSASVLTKLFPLWIFTRVLRPACPDLFLLLLLFTAVFLGCNMNLMGDICSCNLASEPPDWPWWWSEGVGEGGSEEAAVRRIPGGSWNQEPPSIFNGGVASPLRLHRSHRLFIRRRRVIRSGTSRAGEAGEVVGGGGRWRGGTATASASPTQNKTFQTTGAEFQTAKLKDKEEKTLLGF